MKILVTSRYRARGVVYAAGEVLDLPDGVALALLNDSPGSFAPYDPPAAAVIPAPPADTMTRRPPRRKG